MSAAVKCPCGEIFPASASFDRCPHCLREIPGAGAQSGAPEPDGFAVGEIEEAISESVMTRMFEALLDPRAIQRLLSLGGTLAVVGLIVWLVSVGVFDNPLNQAIGFAVGTGAMFGIGWWLSLRTRYRLAGEAVTFLASVVAPLNLWFYDAQNLLTIDGHLWLAGVACCLVYGATLFVLQRPLFLYAFQAGMTLTGLLLIADFRSVSVMDAAVMLASMGLVAIHLERAFPIGGEFDRRRFGPPLLWTGLAQLAFAVVAVLPLQVLQWSDVPLTTVSWLIDAARLDVTPLVAAGLWLAAAYAAFYVAMVPRLAGGWTTLAACGCLLMAEATVLINADASAEGAIVALALTAAVACVAAVRLVERGTVPRQAALSSAVLVSSLPLGLGYLLFARGVMPSFRAFGWERAFDAAYPLAMTLTAACFAASAMALRGHRRHAAMLRFFTAGAVLLATAGAIRMAEMPWSMGAAILTLIPIGYLIEGILKKDDIEVSIAYAAFGFFSASAFLAVCHQGLELFVPRVGKVATLGTAIVGLEATIFLLMAASRAQRLRQTSLAMGLAAASAGTAAVMVWQGVGFAGAPAGGMVPSLAAAALILAGLSRCCGRRSLATPAFVAAATLLFSTAAFSNFRTLGLLFGESLQWPNAVEIGSVAIAALAAAGLAATGAWRRSFASVAAVSAAVTVLAVASLAELNGWQRLEAMSVAAGVMLLVSGHAARFRENAGRPEDVVDVALWSGALFAMVPLTIAMLYHRVDAVPSLADELALTTLGIAMLATGLAWRLKSTTLIGGGALGGYIVVLIASVLHRPEVTMGAYLTGIGVSLFVIGIGLSVYRDRLLMLPERISKREGLFRILDWR